MSYLQFEDEPGNKECRICYGVYEHSQFFTINSCNEQFCKRCMELYLIHLIDTRDINNIKCPACGTVKLDENEFRGLLNPEYWEKYQKIAKIEILTNNPFVKFCPQPDCEGYGLGSMKSKKIACSLCSFEYCFLCNQKWHTEKCTRIEEAKFELWAVENNVKFCPKCKRRVEKLGGCNNMICICSNSFCWRCGKNPSDPFHEIFCILGKDLWNIKLTWIITLIFAPISIFLIPFILFCVFRHQIPGNQTWWVKHQWLLFLAFFVFSPLILLGMLLGYPCFFASSQSGVLNLFARPFLGIGLVILYIIGLTLGILAVVLAFFASFLCIFFGILLLFLRIFREKCGKKDYTEEFYPQSII